MVLGKCIKLTMLCNLLIKFTQGRTQGGEVDPTSPTTPNPLLAKNQARIPYPKPLKHSNKTKLRLKESKNNFLDIFPYHYNSF